MTQTSSSQTNKTSVSETPGYLSQTPETVPSIIETQRLKCAKPTDTGHSSDSTPSVSVKKSDEEKATISISLPTSILKDQKHFQSVIETINNTLLTKNTEDAYAALVDYFGTEHPLDVYFWSDSAPELIKSAKKMGLCHGKALPGRQAPEQCVARAQNPRCRAGHADSPRARWSSTMLLDLRDPALVLHAQCEDHRRR